MIRVLQFADLINRYDFIENIVCHADRGRFHIDVCTREAAANIAEPTFVDTTTWHRIARSEHNAGATVLALAALLRAGRYDVLHAHHFAQALIGAAAVQLVRSTKLVVGRHYSDSIQHLPFLKRSAYLSLEAFVHATASAIVVPSTMIERLLVDRQRVPARKVVRIPYAFAPEKYAPPPPDRVEAVRRELALDGRLAIGCFGRLFVAKGVDVLLEAFARAKQAVPGVVLVVVGDGTERARLEALAKRLGVSADIRFLGWRTDVMTVMAAVDVVAHASFTEAFCQVMGEALLLGKPLAITDVSGVRDVLRDGVSARIVPVRDVAALATALVDIVRDEPYRRALAAAGGEAARRSLLAPAAIRPYEALYEKLVSVERGAKA